MPMVNLSQIPPSELKVPVGQSHLVQQLDQQCKGLMARLREWQQRAQEQTDDLTHYRNLSTQLKTDNGVLERRMQDLEQKNEHEKREFMQCMNELKAMLDSLQAQYQTQLQQHKQAQARLEEMQGQKQALQGQLAASQQEAARLRNDCSRYVHTRTRTRIIAFIPH
jgi:chromosome segregation ATPase